MIITVIHNLYKNNPHIEQSIKLNLRALQDADVDFQYIIFNDNGDVDLIKQTKSIQAVLKQTRQNSIEYYYSPINYGHKKCSGGWVGAVKEGLVKGDIIHNIGQDDIMTSLFYRKAKETFDNPDYYFFTANAFKVNEQLIPLEIMLPPNQEVIYEDPIAHFKYWFGIIDGKVTRANNFFLAPGTMYRTELHDKIGLPDLDNFAGASDFEYWARILFYGYKGKYFSLPSWYYRISPYSAGNEIIEGKQNLEYWLKLNLKAIQDKYTHLVQQQPDKFK